MIRLARINLREIHLPLVEPFRTASGTVDVRRILLLELVHADGDAAWSECVAPAERGYRSGRTVLRCVARSSSIVVQRWPSCGTHWRGSSQTGQAAGAASVSAYWTPQVTQMYRGIARAVYAGIRQIGRGVVRSCDGHERPDR